MQCRLVGSSPRESRGSRGRMRETPQDRLAPFPGDSPRRWSPARRSAVDCARSAGRSSCRRRSGSKARRRAAHDGLIRGSRRCSAVQDALPRSPRRQTPDARLRRSAPISSRSTTDVRSQRLCGGSPATTNQTRSSLQLSRHCSPRIKCPTWIGSNVPPKNPSRIGEKPLYSCIPGQTASRIEEPNCCRQTWRNRLK